MKIYIKAFSKPQKEIMSKLDSATPEVILHLMKVCLWPNVDSQNKWQHEVWSNLNKVDKLKSCNKYPSAEFIFNNTWVPNNDTISDRVLVLMEDMEESPIRFKAANLYEAIKAYFTWLSTQLSELGIVSEESVRNKLEELRTEYF